MNDTERKQKRIRKKDKDSCFPSFPLSAKRGMSETEESESNISPLQKKRRRKRHKDS